MIAAADTAGRVTGKAPLRHAPSSPPGRSISPSATDSRGHRHGRSSSLASSLALGSDSSGLRSRRHAPGPSRDSTIIPAAAFRSRAWNRASTGGKPEAAIAPLGSEDMPSGQSYLFADAEEAGPPPAGPMRTSVLSYVGASDEVPSDTVAGAPSTAHSSRSVYSQDLKLAPHSLWSSGAAAPKAGGHDNEFGFALTTTSPRASLLAPPDLALAGPSPLARLRARAVSRPPRRTLLMRKTAISRWGWARHATQLLTGTSLMKAKACRSSTESRTLD